MESQLSHSSTGSAYAGLDGAIRGILERNQLKEPDGRPLYAYRTSEEDTVHLEGHIRERLVDQPMTIGPLTAQGFVLWAADVWRREYTGESWSWEFLLSRVGAGYLAPQQPGYPALCTAVVDGLKRWRRSLLRSTRSRLFLGTLVCEGGLPLRLVTGQNHQLRAYFKALFEEVAAQSRVRTLLDGEPAEYARLLSSRLPVSLRQEVVYELCGQLTEEIQSLLPLVRDCVDPIATLDKSAPEWRTRLPLDLATDVARHFLRGLVADAQQAQRTETRAIRWSRRFARISDNGIKGLAPEESQWELQGSLILPTSMSVPMRDSIAGELSVPSRFDLCLQSDRGDLELLAVGSSRGQKQEIAIETIRDSTRLASGHSAAEGHTLVIRTATGQSRGWSDFSGALPLSSLPWVLTQPMGDSDHLDFVAEGTVRVRAAEAFVAYEEGWHLDPLDAGSAEPAGRLLDPPRLVVRIRGSVALQNDAGTRCVMRTDNKTPDDSSYRLSGSQMFVGLDTQPVYKGVPSLLFQLSSGVITRVGGAELRWRSNLLARGATVRAERAIGEGYLIHQVDDETRYETKVRVLPQSLRIRSHPERSNSGRLVVEECAGARCEILTSLDVDVRVEVRGEVTEFALHALSDPPATLRLRLTWQGRGAIDLLLPFPARRIGFLNAAGDPVSSGSSVGVSQISGIQAVAVAPGLVDEFFVEGNFVGRPPRRFSAIGGQVSPRMRLLQRPMVIQPDGSSTLRLSELQQEILRLLNSSDDLDGFVKLRIRSSRVSSVDATLEVTRYDLRLDRDIAGGSLTLPTEARQRLTTEEVSGLRVDAIPLLAPAVSGTVLEPTADGVWPVPAEGFTPGPWLVLGWHGQWCRVRPILCDVPGEMDHAGSPLRLACLHSNQRERERQIASALVELALLPQHPDWLLLADLMRWTAHLPPASFDTIRVLPQVPLALASSMIRLPEIDGSLAVLLMRAQEALPGSILTVTCDQWERVISAYLRADLAEYEQALHLGIPGLGSLDARLDAISGRVAKRLEEQLSLSWIGAVVDIARSAISGDHIAPQTAILFKDQGKDHIRRAYLDAVGRLPSSQGRWNGPHTDGLPVGTDDPFYASVLAKLRVGEAGLNADVERRRFAQLPAILAVRAVAGESLDLAATVQLREVRDYNTEWFDKVYHFAYLFALGHRRHA